MNNTLYSELAVVAPPVTRASILIITYNSAAYIERCLVALRASVAADCEVVVIDNASADGSADIIARDFPDVRLVRNSTNTGFAAAMNQAVARAGGRYVVGLNPDTIAQVGWLDALLAPLADPTVGISTAKIVMMANTQRINACGNTMHYTGITTCRGLDRPATAPELAAPADVSAASGACFALRRDLWHELGGFDDTFFTYLEDTDLSLKARLAGYRIVYVPDAIVQHDYTNRFSPRKLYYLERNRLTMLLRVYSLRTLITILPALILASLVTWGYALLHGRASIMALLRAYGWLLIHISDIQRARRRTQALRRVSDAALFAAMPAALDIGQLAPAPAARFSRAVFDPVFRVCARAVTGSPSASAVRPLRIAHVSATFPPYRGGTGNVCDHNVRELAQRGHDVHVYTAASGSPATESRDGFTIHRLQPLVRVGNAPVLPGLLTALRGYDIIHLHYPFFGGELATLAALVRRCPLVITYHQDVLLHGAMAGVEKVLRHSAGRVTLRRAARVLFTSADYGRASYVRPLLKGRDHSIGALPNGVDTTTYSPVPPPVALRARYGLAPEDRLVLMVAGLDRAHYFKGVDILLTALATLPPHIKAVIVGDGDLRESYSATAHRLGLAGRVHFAGRVSDADLPDYYRLAHVTVLPSVTMGEAFGLVLLESLACATPVIASNLPGVRTVVAAGDDGLLVPPSDAGALADALTRIFADETERVAMGRRGRVKVVAAYDWVGIGAMLEDIYRDVLAERRGDRR